MNLISEMILRRDEGRRLKEKQINWSQISQITLFHTFSDTQIIAFRLGCQLSMLGGYNFIFVQPNLGPPNFFMGMSQGPLDISQNTF